MWLALDTSGDTASVALGEAGGVPRAEARLAGARQHAGALVPMIDRCLREAGIGAAALEGIVLGDGPGSFTGLRVAATVAKAIALARGLAVRTASSLLVQAAGALPPATGVVLGVRDALRGELYGGVYRLEPGAVTTLLPPVVAAPEALAARVAPLGVRGVVGEAPEPVLAALHQRLGAERLAPPAAGAPVLLGLLAREGGTAPVHDLRHWEPEYGRPAEAQRRWEERHGRPLPPAAGESR